MKSFKRYIKEVQGVGPGGGDAMDIGVDSDTGMSAGDVTNADTCLLYTSPSPRDS